MSNGKESRGRYVLRADAPGDEDYKMNGVRMRRSFGAQGGASQIFGINGDDGSHFDPNYGNDEDEDMEANGDDEDEDMESNSDDEDEDLEANSNNEDEGLEACGSDEDGTNSTGSDPGGRESEDEGGEWGGIESDTHIVQCPCSGVVIKVCSLQILFVHIFSSTIAEFGSASENLPLFGKWSRLPID